MRGICLVATVLLVPAFANAQNPVVSQCPLEVVATVLAGNQASSAVGLTSAGFKAAVESHLREAGVDIAPRPEPFNATPRLVLTITGEQVGEHVVLVMQLRYEVAATLSEYPEELVYAPTLTRWWSGIAASTGSAEKVREGLAILLSLVESQFHRPSIPISYRTPNNALQRTRCARR